MTNEVKYFILEWVIPILLIAATFSVLGYGFYIATTNTKCERECLKMGYPAHVLSDMECYCVGQPGEVVQP